MSLGLIYLIVLAVSVICGFLGRNTPNTRLNLVAAAFMLAGCIYATLKYSWFHILGLVGITLVGINVFNAISMMNQRRAEEQARIDKIFAVDDDETKKED